MDLYEIAEKLEDETLVGAMDDLAVQALTLLGWRIVYWDTDTATGYDGVNKVIVPPKVELVWF